MKRLAALLPLILAAVFAWAWLSTKQELADLRGSLLQADTIKRAVDGDTVELARLGKVRLMGVDTPETWQKVGKKWQRIENPDPRGVMAFEWLRALEGLPVRVQTEEQTRDRYGRALVHLYLLPSGPDLATELLRRRLGVVMAIPPNTKRLGDWKAAVAKKPTAKAP